jgi:hypothetical protein
VVATELEPFIDRFRWPSPFRGPFLLSVSWHPVDGRLQPVKLTLESASADEPVPITGTLLRQLRLSDLLARIQTQQDAAGSTPSGKAGIYFPRITAKPAETDPLFKRDRGRPPIYPDDHYQEVARIYSTATATPVKAVAQAMTLSQSAAAKQVARARKLGFLLPTSKGRRSAPPD